MAGIGRVELRAQRSKVERSLQLQPPVGGEGHHHRERRERVRGHLGQRSVDPRLPRAAVDHHQLAVAAVEGPEAQAAPLQQLADGHVPVEVAVEQRLDRRRLEQRVLAPLGPQLAVPEQLDPQRIEEGLFAHARSLGRETVWAWMTTHAEE